MQNPPTWLKIEHLRYPPAQALMDLDPGERDAIALAIESSIDTIIIDEIKGRLVAESLHLTVRGTIGILADAAQLGLVDLKDCIARLERERFYMSPTFKKRILVDLEKGPS